MKMKKYITKGRPWKELEEAGKCVACAGSGLYDYRDKRGRMPKCASCGGTGREEVDKASPTVYSSY